MPFPFCWDREACFRALQPRAAPRPGPLPCCLGRNNPESQGTTRELVKLFAATKKEELKAVLLVKTMRLYFCGEKKNLDTGHKFCSILTPFLDFLGLVFFMCKTDQNRSNIGRVFAFYLWHSQNDLFFREFPSSVAWPNCISVRFGNSWCYTRTLTKARVQPNSNCLCFSRGYQKECKKYLVQKNHEVPSQGVKYLASWKSGCKTRRRNEHRVSYLCVRIAGDDGEIYPDAPRCAAAGSWHTSPVQSRSPSDPS